MLTSSSWKVPRADRPVRETRSGREGAVPRPQLHGERRRRPGLPAVGLGHLAEVRPPQAASGQCPGSVCRKVSRAVLQEEDAVAHWASRRKR